MELRIFSRQGCRRWGIVGIIMFTLGILMIFVNPLKHIIRWNTTMRAGGFAESMWKVLPVDVINYVYIFNITNHERFLKGEDTKLVFDEIGPYVFREHRTNDEITYNDNGTMTYIPNITVKYVPERSVGDIYTDNMITINIPYLGIVSMNSDASLLKKIGVNVVSANSPTFVNVPVNGFLWGYEDPLIQLSSSYLPHWIDFEKFGILDRLYASKRELVTVNLNESAGDPYKIQYWNGSPGLEQWNFKDMETSLPCNTVNGTFEGLILPPDMSNRQSFKVYKKLFCRTMNLVYQSNKTEPSGLQSVTYTIPREDAMCSNPDNSCYCPKNGYRPADTLIDIAPCYYGLPLALSNPHFYGADDSLSEHFVGMSPDPEKHVTSMTYEPNIGMPLNGKIRTQVNLVMKDSDYNLKARPLSNLAIPIMWLDSRFEGLPNHLTIMLLMAFKYLPIVQVVLSWFLVLIGLILFIGNAVSFLRLPDVTSLQNRRTSANYVKAHTGNKLNDKNAIHVEEAKCLV